MVPYGMSSFQAEIHGRVRVVLVRPREPGNVGAAARAMFNLGFTDLCIVPGPRAPREDLLGEAAFKMATHGRPVVESASRVPDLAAATAQAVGVFAFSARLGRTRSPRLSVEAAMQEAAARARTGRVALLFGPEDFGLSRSDLEHATHLVHIAAPGRHPVFNLSQAVLLALWELCRASVRVHEKLPVVGRGHRLASNFEREHLRTHWSRTLESLGYAPAGRGSLHARILSRLLDLLERGGNQHNDFALLLGLAEAIDRRALPCPARRAVNGSGSGRKGSSRTRGSGPS
jgi:TrmH family RNA methyltransferase